MKMIIIISIKTFGFRRTGQQRDDEVAGDQSHSATGPISRKKTRPITFRCRAYLVAFYLSLGLYGVGLSVSLLRSVAGPNEFLADHLEKLVVERPEEVAESLESIFVDVGVLAPLGLPETLERRLGVVGAFQARKSFRRIENKVLFRDHSTQA